MKTSEAAQAATEPTAASTPADTTFWVYVVRCADDTLYTGVARDVEKRMAEHNGAGTRGARYTAARRPVALVYQAVFANRSLAQREEARIKSLSRSDKQVLIGQYKRARKAKRR
jgi:putative endonuclease